MPLLPHVVSVQVAAEMKCAFKGADKRGLVVVPTEYNISLSRGMSVFYPYAGINLSTRFCLLRTNKSPSLLTEVNVAAVHLGWGLQDVHNKVCRDRQWSGLQPGGCFV